MVFGGVQKPATPAAGLRTIRACSRTGAAVFYTPVQSSHGSSYNTGEPGKTRPVFFNHGLCGRRTRSCSNEEAERYRHDDNQKCYRSARCGACNQKIFPHPFHLLFCWFLQSVPASPGPAGLPGIRLAYPVACSCRHPKRLGFCRSQSQPITMYPRINATNRTAPTNPDVPMAPHIAAVVTISMNPFTSTVS